MWEKWLGPASLVYIISASAAALWWAATLSNKVDAVDKQVQYHSALPSHSDTNARLTRVETLLVSVDKQLDKIEAKLDRRP